MLLAVFLYSIYHLFNVLPTSFVPNEDQGYAMSRRSSCRRRRASPARRRSPSKADEIFKAIPGVETRTVVTGYSLLDSGFKTNAATIFVTFSDFDERYKNIDDAKKENVRAILQSLLRGGAQDRGRDRDSDRAAGDPRHRHHRRLRVLDPGHGHRRPGRARRRAAGLPQEGARATRS